jgi:hypothetical protein
MNHHMTEFQFPMFLSHFEWSLINHCGDAKKHPAQKNQKEENTKIPALIFLSLYLSRFPISAKSPAICNLRVNQPVVFLLFASPQGAFYVTAERTAREIETLFEKLLVTERESSFFCIASRCRKGARRTPHGAFVLVCVPPWSTGDLCFLLLCAARTRRVSVCVHAAFVNGRVTQSGEDTAAAALSERGPRIKRHIHLYSV